MPKKNKNPLVSPILKWVGGKRQLLDQIAPKIPPHTTYYEPFVGGAAILFNLQPKKAIINDSNPELINVYNVIKEEPDVLIQSLKNHKDKNSEDYFYQIRSMDRNIEEYSKLSNVERASRIIYLNKTCYNGLFRVNSSGEFNSPWGKYKNPNIVCETTIHAINRYLNKFDVRIQCGDYSEALNGIRKGSFVYFDPPYMPISSSSSFTGYTATGFGEDEQIALKEKCDELNRRGIKFLLSNSDCPFINNLYQDYIIETVSAKRIINADPDKRGDVKEVLVRNYELD